MWVLNRFLKVIHKTLDSKPERRIQNLVKFKWSYKAMKKYFKQMLLLCKSIVWFLYDANFLFNGLRWSFLWKQLTIEVVNYFRKKASS